MSGPRTELAPPVARGHDPALDGVRGLAITGVLLYHFNVLHQPSSTTEAVWRGVMNAGWVGVDLFFVLSGFLITALLLDDKERVEAIASTRRRVTVYFGGFLARRALRIFPLYYAFLLASFVVLPRLAPVIGNGGITTVLPDEPLWFFAYLPNFLFAREGAFVGGRHFHLTWSLGVEEQFYLLWPLVVFVLRKETLRVVVSFLVVTAFGLRMMLDDGGATWIALFVLPYTRMDALAAGALVAVLDAAARADGRPWRGPARALGALTFVAGLAFAVVVGLRHGQYAQFEPTTYRVGLTVNALAFAGLLVVVGAAPVHHPLRRALSLAPLRGLGRYAYGLYLLHIFVQHLVVGPLLARPSFAALVGPRLLQQLVFTALCFAGSVVLAIVVHHALERPFLALKRHFRHGG